MTDWLLIIGPWILGVATYLLTGEKDSLIMTMLLYGTILIGFTVGCILLMLKRKLDKSQRGL